MITMIVGGVVKVTLNYFLVAQPRINIYGAPVGTLVSYVVMAVMNFVFMCYVLDKNPKLRNILIKPFLCSTVMGGCAWGLFGLCDRFLRFGSPRIHMLMCMGIAILAAAAVYLFFAIAMKMITKEDMRLIPGGAKIAKLLHMQ